MQGYSKKSLGIYQGLCYFRKNKSMKVLLIFISKSRLFAQCLKMYECHMFVYVFIQISAVCLQLEKMEKFNLVFFV